MLWATLTVDVLKGFLPQVIEAVIYAFVGFTIARATGRVLLHAWREVQLDALTRFVGLRTFVGPLLSRVVEYALYIATIGFILYRFNILRAILIGLGVIAGFLALASISLWLVDFLPNLIAGMRYRTALRAGKAAGLPIKGKVHHWGITNVVLVSENQNYYYVPYRWLSRHTQKEKEKKKPKK